MPKAIVLAVNKNKTSVDAQQELLALKEGANEPVAKWELRGNWLATRDRELSSDPACTCLCEPLCCACRDLESTPKAKEQDVASKENEDPNASVAGAEDADAECVRDRDSRAFASADSLDC